MTRPCTVCGGTGRILYPGEADWDDCPACDGTGTTEHVEPDDSGAVREPDAFDTFTGAPR